ncbi:MAG: divergent polysaccharide deacetylase family protein [Pseudomonadota bacterium]
MSWKNRNRGQQPGGSWTGGFLKGLVSGSMLTALAMVGVLYLLPPAPLPEDDGDAAAEDGGAGVSAGVDSGGTETAALREERGRSGPTTEGNFAEETVLPDAPAAAPSRAPSVSVPGGGGAPVVAPSQPGGDTDTIAGLDSSALGTEDGDAGLSGLVPRAPSGGDGLSAPSAPSSVSGLAPGGLSSGPASPSAGGLVIAPPITAAPTGAQGGEATELPASGGGPTSLLLDGGAATPAPAAPPATGVPVPDTPGVDVTLDPGSMTAEEARQALAALEAEHSADLPDEAAPEGVAAGEPGAASAETDLVASLPTDPQDIAEMSPEEARRALEALEAIGTGDDASALEPSAATDNVQADPVASSPSADAVAGVDDGSSEPAAIDTAALEQTVPENAPAAAPAEPPEEAPGVPLGAVIEPGVEVEDVATGIVPLPAIKPDPDSERQAALETDTASDAGSDDAPGTSAPLDPSGLTSDSEDAAAAPSSGDARLALAGPALEVNAREFTLASGAQAISLVLLSPLEGAEVPLDALESLGFPVTVGLPTAARDVRAAAERLRAAGHELIAELPADAAPEEAQAALAAMPLGVAAALMDGANSGGRPQGALLTALSENGFAFFDSRSIGGGAALRAARSAGIPAISPDRGATSSTTEGQLLQTLNIAALVAKRQGTAVVVAPATPAALRAALTFALEGAGGVTMAPLSAIIRRRGTG